MTCITKNGRLQINLSAEVIIAHAEFIIASHGVEKGSRRPSSLSVTTQNEPNVSKARVVSTWQK